MYLHSTMVLLKGDVKRIDGFRPLVFTFHYGSIKS